MEITINNEKKFINQSNLLSVITSVLGDKTKGIAVAVNQTVIPRANWELTELKEMDNVMIIKATQGG